MRERHFRQGFLGEHSEREIKDSRVAIIGLCGGGSPTAQQLAHIGIGTFDLFDYDKADKTNTNRMIGLSREAAEKEEPKVDIIERLIKSINPDAVVNKYFGSWMENHLVLRSATAIFGCVDSYLARSELERYARRYLVPYIDLGMDVHGEKGKYSISGQVIMSLPGHHCMQCMGFITKERLAKEAEKYGQAGGNPQVIWPNGVLASVAISKFMALITPWNSEVPPSLYSEYDGNRAKVFDSNILAALAGRVCPHHDGKNGVGEIWL